MATPGLQKGRMAFVRFERRAIEDRKMSIEKGHFSTVDADFAIISPIGGKDTVVRLVKEWFEYLDQQVQEERVPVEWVDKYKMAYEKFKIGEELPVDGTPIKGWPVLSPAQQSNIVAIGVRSVEDLAEATEEALAQIGLGGRSLREKARNWLESANNVGKLAERMTSSELLVAEQKATIESLQSINSELRARLEALEEKV